MPVRPAPSLTSGTPPDHLQTAAHRSGRWAVAAARVTAAKPSPRPVGDGPGLTLGRSNPQYAERTAPSRPAPPPTPLAHAEAITAARSRHGRNTASSRTTSTGSSLVCTIVNARFGLPAADRNESSARPAGSLPPFNTVSRRAASPHGCRYSTSSPGPSSTTASSSTSRSAVARFSCHHHNARAPHRPRRTTHDAAGTKPRSATRSITADTEHAANRSGRNHNRPTSAANCNACVCPSTPRSVAQPSRTRGSSP
ncbi:hypothetical protein [Amycolatopsis sp. NPDC004079]|uniref:hypothetical protein n=1 Tax=Amycolatopsis sp. NPDC004079 TaxID=3154549 RepID=UPI0033A31F26